MVAVEEGEGDVKQHKMVSELYYVDYKRILKLKMLDKLGRKETAKVLYTFFEALPANPAPVSIERLRARLNLKSSVSVQNTGKRRKESVADRRGSTGKFNSKSWV